MKAVFLNSDPHMITHVYASAQMARLAALVDLDQQVYSLDDVRAGACLEAEAVFSTWGMPVMTEEEIAQYLPKLQVVYYAAGSVQYFARPFLNKGVRVFSAWQANGVAVAQFTFAQILLSTKGYFRVQPAMRSEGREAAYKLFHEHPGAYDVKIGLLGCGAIGTQVAQMLKDIECEVWVYDPFLSEEKAKALNVRISTMEEIFANCLIISNHIANLPTTVGIIRREHFLSMMPNSTFINTGRGPQLRDEDLVEALTQDPSRTALLDVMNDEGKTDNGPLATLPNVFVTPHMAGTAGNEVRRMADYMISCCEQELKGEKAPYQVSLKMLETMA